MVRVGSLLIVQCVHEPYDSLFVPKAVFNMRFVEYVGDCSVVFRCSKCKREVIVGIGE